MRTGAAVIGRAKLLALRLRLHLALVHGVNRLQAFSDAQGEVLKGNN